MLHAPAGIMNEEGSYKEYAASVASGYADDASDCGLLVEAAKDVTITRVLDIGCGLGQDLIPFAKNGASICVGIDIGSELGTVANEFIRKLGTVKNVQFTRSRGESLPFGDESFDVVICRIALPYMNNKLVISEVARVLRPGGVFLLRTHTIFFYFGMLKRRFFSFSLRQYAYPIICLIGGFWHLFTGQQLESGFWKGKELFQTRGFLRREFQKHNMKISGTLRDHSLQSHSFLITKETPEN